jgi:hypothetical protein
MDGTEALGYLGSVVRILAADQGGQVMEERVGPRSTVPLSFARILAAGTLLLFLAGSPLAAPAVAEPSATTRLTAALTGKVRQVVLVRRAGHPGGFETYSIRIGGRWRAGVIKATVGPGLDCALVDLDFDGSADVWVTGYDDGQARIRRSDVWRFDPRRGSYVFDRALSSLENLEVDPGARLLEAGIDNCGCAGDCFYRDTYEWQGGKLRRVARREQDCDTYLEFAACGDSLCLVRQVPAGEPDHAEAVRRRTGGHRFLSP